MELVNRDSVFRFSENGVMGGMQDAQGFSSFLLWFCHFWWFSKWSNQWTKGAEKLWKIIKNLGKCRKTLLNLRSSHFSVMFPKLKNRKCIVPRTMGQGSEKIDLSPSESWDLLQNDQRKLYFALDLAVSVRNCAGFQLNLWKHTQIVSFWQISSKFLEDYVAELGSVNK